MRRGESGRGRTGLSCGQDGAAPGRVSQDRWLAAPPGEPVGQFRRGVAPAAPSGGRGIAVRISAWVGVLLLIFLVERLTSWEEVVTGSEVD